MLWPSLLLSCGSDPWVNTPAHTKYALFSVVDSMNGTLIKDIGRVAKHPANPLLVQDQPTELRLDNGYPNIIHEPSDRLGAYRLWYGGFYAGSKFDTSQGSGRLNG